MSETQVLEYIPESERGVFSQLSPESQKVLRTHYERMAGVMDTAEIGTVQTPENIGETIKFGLTPAEKQSIEADINAGKPIMAHPAYTKFLIALLPTGLKVEDENRLLIFSHDTPEYEIHNRAIRANYAGAIAIIAEGLSELFGRRVRLPTNDEVRDQIAKHNHYKGYRDSSEGGSFRVNDDGYGWVAGDTDDFYAQYTQNSRTSGDLQFQWFSSDNGLSLFPYFG